MKFTDPLIVKKLAGRIWEIMEPFDYHVGSKDSLRIVSVPKGFVTDLASVPRMFWIIFPPDGQYTKAAVIHDFCYFKRLFRRRTCDAIFYEAMGVLKVPLWKRWIMHKAVRVGGWVGWRKHRKRELINK